MASHFGKIIIIPQFFRKRKFYFSLCKSFARSQPLFSGFCGMSSVHFICSNANFWKLSKANFWIVCMQPTEAQLLKSKGLNKQVVNPFYNQLSRWLNAECASSTVYSTNAVPHQLILQGLQQPTVSVYTGKERSIIATTACRTFIGIKLTTAADYNYRLASISSRVSPFVSGTIQNINTRDATAITPNPEKSAPVPIKSYDTMHTHSYHQQTSDCTYIAHDMNS